MAGIGEEDGTGDDVGIGEDDGIGTGDDVGIGEDDGIGTGDEVGMGEDDGIGTENEVGKEEERESFPLSPLIFEYRCGNGCFPRSFRDVENCPYA